MLARSIVRRARSLCTRVEPLSDEWAKAGLGVRRAAKEDVLNRLLFVEVGFGCDQHGDRSLGSTKAALRAVRDAISFNSIPGIVEAVPGGRENMLIHLKVGVPAEFPDVDTEALARVFPYVTTQELEHCCALNPLCSQIQRTSPCGGRASCSRSRWCRGG